MPIITSQIIDYEVRLERTQTAPSFSVGRAAIIICDCGDTETMNIWFYAPEMAATRENSTFYFTNWLGWPVDPPITLGFMRVSMEKYVWFLDLLRNESPVYAVFDSDNPRNNNIRAILST